MSTPQPGPGDIGIDNVSGGKIIGTGVGGTGNTVAESVTFHGPVINLHGVSGDFAQVLHAIQRISTDIPAGGAPAPAPVPREGTSMQSRIDELLELMRSAEARGETALRVAAGPVQLSRVELLVKKAVLLVDEANRLSVQALGPRGAELAAGLDPGALGEMLVGCDSPAAIARLREAQQVLREAVRLAPENTGVLLHMAQVFGRLSQKATDDERAMLRHVLRLLGTPRTDEQRLHHAQATYLLGSVGEERDPTLLAQARAEFAALGRVEWVRRCDDALATGPESASAQASFRAVADEAAREPVPWRAAPAPRRRHDPRGTRGQWAAAAVAILVMAVWFVASELDSGTVDDTTRTTQSVGMPAPAPPAEASFDPVGAWWVEIQDQVFSTMAMELSPDGTFTGAQQVGGVDYGFRGRWRWDEASQQLTLEGSVDGVGPARVWYTIEGRDGGIWLAREGGGNQARFKRQ